MIREIHVGNIVITETPTTEGFSAVSILYRNPVRVGIDSFKTQPTKSSRELLQAAIAQINAKTIGLLQVNDELMHKPMVEIDLYS
jgi:hypothetical protein